MAVNRYEILQGEYSRGSSFSQGTRGRGQREGAWPERGGVSRERGRGQREGGVAVSEVLPRVTRRPDGPHVGGPDPLTAARGTLRHLSEGGTGVCIRHMRGPA